MFLNSDCKSLEEDLSRYERDTYTLPTSSSSSTVISSNVTPTSGCFSQQPQSLSDEYCLNTHRRGQSIVSNSQIVGSSDSKFLRSSANNKNKTLERKNNILDPVMTGPADSSFGDPSDTKYKEKRQRNNMAAKKSRDARKIRENQLKVKVLCLENANQVLRSQVHREQEENRQQADTIKALEQQIKELRQLQTCSNCLTTFPLPFLKSSNSVVNDNTKGAVLERNYKHNK